MSQNDSKNPFEVWKSGVPLDAAVDAFGMQRGLSKIRQKAQATAMATAESAKASFRKVDKNLDEFFDAVGTFQASFVGDAQVRSAKEARLIEQLRSGALVAWGFPVHDRSATEPVQVPSFMFSRDFAKWLKRSLVGHDRHFADVTVREAAGISQPMLDIPNKTEHGKRGPQSIDPLIAAAIKHLRSVDAHFENRSQEKRINDIRAEVARLNPGRFSNGSQPGHTTVWTYLRKNKSAA